VSAVMLESEGEKLLRRMDFMLSLVHHELFTYLVLFKAETTFKNIQTLNIFCVCTMKTQVYVLVTFFKTLKLYMVTFLILFSIICWL
jgi:hypothetical protein